MPPPHVRFRRFGEEREHVRHDPGGLALAECGRAREMLDELVVRIGGAGHGGYPAVHASDNQSSCPKSGRNEELDVNSSAGMSAQIYTACVPPEGQAFSRSG